MVRHTSSPPTAQTAGDKNGTSDINAYLDDAPLFAGLDDYIFKQTAGKAKDTVEKVKKDEKRKNNRQKQPKREPAPLPKIAAAQKKPAIEVDSPLLSVTEMCALLKISRATLVRMDKSGQLPGRIKLGGSVRFHRETIDNWLKSLMTGSHPPTPPP